MIKVGLVGYGKAGQAVAQVLREDSALELCWIVRQSAGVSEEAGIPIVALADADWGAWLDAHPVDALVDFSRPQALHSYGEPLRQRHTMLVSAISAYSSQDLDYARAGGSHAGAVLPKYHGGHQLFDPGRQVATANCAVC